jgi:hypothetical protein
MDEAPDTREVRISKALTLILRNKALIRGLHVASDGYVLAEDVLHCPPVARHGATMSDIQKITFESKKQRFQLKQGLDGNGGPIYIRAVQGHSMTVVRDENLGRSLRADDSNLPVCLRRRKTAMALMQINVADEGSCGKRELLLELAAAGADVPDFVRSDAEERSLLFPPGWRCEPSTPAYCLACFPWMEKKSDAVSSEASAMPASGAFRSSRHRNGKRELLQKFAVAGEDVPDLVRSDAEERSQLFPPGWRCEPSTPAYGSACCPWMEKKSHVVASAMPASGAFRCSRHGNTSRFKKITPSADSRKRVVPTLRGTWRFGVKSLASVSACIRPLGRRLV